jgi:hypothetical protein
MRDHREERGRGLVMISTSLGAFVLQPLLGDHPQPAARATPATVQTMISRQANWQCKLHTDGHVMNEGYQALTYAHVNTLSRVLGDWLGFGADLKAEAMKPDAHKVLLTSVKLQTLAAHSVVSRPAWRT